MGTRIGLKGVAPIRTFFREWREYRGMTLKDVAQAMGTTKQSIWRIESGTNDWTKGFVESFAHVCQCDNPLDPLLRSPRSDQLIDAILANASEVVRRQVTDYALWVVHQNAEHERKSGITTVYPVKTDNVQGH